MHAQSDRFVFKHTLLNLIMLAKSKIICFFIIPSPRPPPTPTRPSPNHPVYQQRCRWCADRATRTSRRSANQKFVCEIQPITAAARLIDQSVSVCATKLTARKHRDWSTSDKAMNEFNALVCFLAKDFLLELHGFSCLPFYQLIEVREQKLSRVGVKHSVPVITIY